jgi:hypothetical protein
MVIYYFRIFWLYLFMYVIQHYFICRPSDSTETEDAGIEPRIVATLALTVKRSYHSARSHPLFGYTRLYLITETVLMYVQKMVVIS